MLESHFSPRSYGFRRNKSTKQCVGSIVACLKQYKEPYIYDCDLKSYFDTINLRRCIHLLRKNHKIYDSTFLKWIENIMHCSVDGKYNGIGLAQGSILGPVLANVMLHDWEEELAHINGYSKANLIGRVKNTFLDNTARALNKGTYETHYKRRRRHNRIGSMFRYADDFVIISNNEIDLKQIICRFKLWCKRNGLTVNEDKSKIVTKNKYGIIKLDFLGYGIKVDREKKVIIHIKNETDKIRSIRKHLRKCLWNGRPDLFLSSLLGYINYYDINTNIRKLIRVVDNMLYGGQPSIGATTIKKVQAGEYELMSKLKRFQHRDKPYTINMWNMRTLTSKSYKEYLRCKDWEPKEMYGDIYNWINEVMKHKVQNLDARLTCFIPGLVMKWENEPVLNIPYQKIDPASVEIHHRTPIKYGGTNDFTNLLLVDIRSHKAIHSRNYNINCNYSTKVLEMLRKSAQV